MAIPNESAYVARRCAELGLKKLDTPDATVQFAFSVLNQIAAELHAADPNWGLLYKPTGANVKERATDILTWKNGSALEHFDVIVDADGLGGNGPKAGWIHHGPVDPSRYRVPFDVPPPPPPPPPPTECNCQAELAVLRARLEDVLTGLSALANQSERNRAENHAMHHKARPITIKAGWMGTLTGEVGGPKA